MSETLLAKRSRKFAPIVVAAGIAAALLLAFSVSGALSGFTASINNSTNTVASGTLLMTETQGATTCLSSAAGTVTTLNAGTCATINKLSGQTAAVPGTVYASTVTVKNDGTLPANTFTLTPAGCTASANGADNGTDLAGFCGKVDLTIADVTNTKCLFPVLATACPAPSAANNLVTLGTTPIVLAVPLAPGASRTFTFSVMLDNSATNAHQGLSASEPLLWSFAS